jgi:hypothetical protein
MRNILCKPVFKVFDGRGGRGGGVANLKFLIGVDCNI